MEQMLSTNGLPVMKLNDFIENKVVTLDEWIQNEIYRLRNNIKPRHFKDYSELVYIFEDASRLQLFIKPNNSFLPPPPPPELIFNIPTDEEEEEEDEEEEEEKQEDEITESTSNTPPIWLCRAFIELLRSCDNLPSTLNCKPRRLLYEVESLRSDVSLGKVVDVNKFRNLLQSILFGNNIQLTENLVNVWKLFCEWVTRPPIHTHQNALRWLDLTLNAYITAKKIYNK